MVLPKRGIEQLQSEIEEERKKTKTCLVEKKRIEEELNLFRKKYTTDTVRRESRVQKQNEEANRSRQETVGLKDEISDLKIRLGKVEFEEQQCKQRAATLEGELLILKGQVQDLKTEVHDLKSMEKEAVLRQLALSIEFEFKKKYVIPALTSAQRVKYFYGGIYCDAAEVQQLNYFRTLLADSELKTRVIKDTFSGDEHAYDGFRSTMDVLKKFSRGGAHPVTYDGKDITFEVVEHLIDDSDMEPPSKRLTKVYARWIYPHNVPMTAKLLKAREDFR